MNDDKEDIVERLLADYREWRAKQPTRIGTHSDRCHLWHERCMIHRLAAALEQAREAIRRLAWQDATLSVQGGNVIVEIDAPEREAEPAALGVLRVGGGWVSILANEVQAETSRQSWDKRENWVHEVVPLYRSPTLTDAEREAVEWAVEHLQASGWGTATLRGLLERTAH